MCGSDSRQVIITGFYKNLPKNFNGIKLNVNSVIQIGNEKHHVHRMGIIFQPLCACQTFFYF